MRKAFLVNILQHYGIIAINIEKFEVSEKKPLMYEYRTSRIS